MNLNLKIIHFLPFSFGFVVFLLLITPAYLNKLRIKRNSNQTIDYGYETNVTLKRKFAKIESSIRKFHTHTNATLQDLQSRTSLMSSKVDFLISETTKLKLECDKELNVTQNIRNLSDTIYHAVKSQVQVLITVENTTSMLEKFVTDSNAKILENGASIDSKLMIHIENQQEYQENQTKLILALNERVISLEKILMESISTNLVKILSEIDNKGNVTHLANHQLTKEAESEHFWKVIILSSFSIFGFTLILFLLCLVMKF